MSDIRSIPQNSKSHAMFTDIRNQAVIKLPGKRIVMSSYSEEAAKALLVMWFANECELNGEPLQHPPETVLCPMTGQNITIRPSTTKFLKAENINFIEWLYAFGCESGVRWSEPALRQYETYRQAA
jgi:NinB protein